MAPNALLEKIKKNSTIKTTASIMESKVWGKKDMVPTDVPMVNLALSCDFDGGIMPGHLQIAGPSKHFKSGFMLLLGSAFLKKYEDGVVLFYDSEFGTPESYFDAVEMDKSRVVHTPITNVEELKFDLANQLKNINKGDHIMILVDSLGNLASLKEVEDAENEKSVADMTRAKALKSLFRIITPHLNLKDIPMVSINHTYKEIGLFPKDIVGGGCVTQGTQIRLSNGNTKSIENFIDGDVVETMYGPRQVTNVWNPDTLVNGEPECYEIEFEDGNKYVVSDQHKFMVNDQWIEAKHLKIGMECKSLV